MLNTMKYSNISVDILLFGNVNFPAPVIEETFKAIRKTKHV